MLYSIGTYLLLKAELREIEPNRRGKAPPFATTIECTRGGDAGGGVASD